MMKSIIFLILPCLVLSFTPAKSHLKNVQSSSLSMVKFDKQMNKWITEKPEEGPEAGYDIWGSLLRKGPLPFFNRVFKADDYEQAVLKFMAGDKVDRMTAQANMDAFLENPNDWAYNRLNGYNVDYLTLNKKAIALTSVWSVGILTLLGRGAYCVATGDNYWAILKMTSKIADCVATNNCILT